MEGFGGLMIIVFIWLFIGVPIAAVSRSKKKGGTFPNKNTPGQGGTASETNQNAAPVRAQETVQDTLAPRVAYGSHDDSIYQGSLNAETGEGYDPCHESELQGLNEAEAPILQSTDSAPSLPFGWTGSDMVKGIVISEVLKRRV